MTCRDCIHYFVCETKNEKVSLGTKVEELVSDNFTCFKNKADFVEVEKIAEMFAEQIGDFPCNVNDNAELLCIHCDCKCSMKCWEQFVRQYRQRK